MQDNHKIWLYLFGILAIANLSAEFLTSTWLIYATKPLLMILLSIYFYLSTKLSTKLSLYVFLGFVFSFFGDTFLMFVENNVDKAHFFLLGLGSFLLTHLFYLLAFLNYPEAKQKGFVRRNLWILLPFFLYLIGNSLFLWNDIPDDLKIAVVIYSSMIVAMTAGCLNLNGLMKKPLFQSLFLGVALFVLSDTIIGLNKFKSAQLQLPYPRLLIMIPYLLSQYLIAKASIKISNEQIIS